MELIVQIGFVLLAIQAHHARREQSNVETSLLPLSATTIPGTTLRTTSPGSVSWESQEYSVDEGIRVLMRVILDAETSGQSREKALDQLGQHAASLGTTDRIPKLLELYDGLQSRKEKGGVLLCLMNAQDPRAFPLFNEVLERERDHVLRLLAASALARWNARRGVEELIKGLESSEAIKDRTVKGQAMGLFLSLNTRKGWGFPEREIRRALETERGLAVDQVTARWLEEIRSWFDANKERFSDWKEGDPLPKAPKQERDPDAE